MKRSIIYILIISALMISCAILHPPEAIQEVQVSSVGQKDTTYICVRLRPSGNRICLQASSTRPMPERLRIVAQVQFTLISSSGTMTPAVCPMGVTINTGQNENTALSPDVLHEFTSFIVTGANVSLSRHTSLDGSTEYALRQNNIYE